MGHKKWWGEKRKISTYYTIIMAFIILEEVEIFYNKSKSDKSKSLR